MSDLKPLGEAPYRADYEVQIERVDRFHWNYHVKSPWSRLSWTHEAAFFTRRGALWAARRVVRADRRQHDLGSLEVFNVDPKTLQETPVKRGGNRGR